MNLRQRRFHENLSLAREGLATTRSGAIVRAFRRQAVQDYPILRQLAPLLKTPKGRRMQHWDRLAFAAELIVLKYRTTTVARNAGISTKTTRYLRSKMLLGGMLSSTHLPRPRQPSLPIPKETIEGFLRFPITASLRKVAGELNVPVRLVGYLRQRCHPNFIKRLRRITAAESALYATFPRHAPIKRIAAKMGISYSRARSLRRRSG